MARDTQFKDAEGLLKKLEALRGRLADHGGDLPDLEGALADLSAAAEELSAADEAIRYQAREVAESRRIVEAERQKYRDLFDLAPAAYVTTDAFGVIEEANRAAAAMLGVEPHHLAGKPLSGFVAEEDREVLHRLAMGWTPHTRLRRGEVRVGPRGGEAVAAAVAVTPAVDAAGQVTALRWLFRDVTERRRREEEFRALVVHSPDAVVRIDTQGRLLYANPVVEELHGVPVKRMLGKTMREAGAPEETADRWDEAMNRVLLTGEQQTFEFRLKVRGRWRWFQTRLVPEFGSDGTVMTMLAVSREVTELRHALERAEAAEEEARRARDGLEDEVRRRTSELVETNAALEAEVRRRKEAQADLRETSELLQRLFDTTHLLAAYMDTNLTFVRVNRAYAQAAGRHPDAFVGRRYEDLDTHAEHGEIFRRVLRTGRPHHVPEKPLVLAGRPERGTTYWDWTVQPVVEDDGTVSGLLLTLVDVTEEKRLRDEVIGAGEAERQRVGQDLHDSLGQDLTGLAYVAEMLAKRLTEDGSSLADRAETVGRLARKAAREVRTVARGLCPVDLSDAGFVEALQDLVDTTREVYGLACTLECPAPVPVRDITVATDLYRIVQEAIHNAVRHAEPRRLWVRVVPDEGALTLTIEDDGKGLPEGADGGDGLGLRVMQYRCHRIGGRLEVSGRPEGGTRVRCVLPALHRHSQDLESHDEPRNA
ncbi:MAG: PAS domain-containing protein [Phycisphaerae bacterium]